MPAKILLAVDLDDQESALRAATAAMRLARAEGRAIALLSVLPAMGFAIVGQAFSEDYESALHDEAARRLAAWGDANLGADIEREVHVAHGKIYDEIIKAADRLGCGTIVMGAHRPELSDYLLGPNAARVVRHARQSVYVVRAPEGDDG